MPGWTGGGMRLAGTAQLLIATSAAHLVIQSSIDLQATARCDLYQCSVQRTSLFPLPLSCQVPFWESNGEYWQRLPAPEAEPAAVFGAGFNPWQYPEMHA